MIENALKRRLHAGETVCGAFYKYPEPELAEYVAALGWDFLVFDGEHGNIASSDLQDLIRACEVRGATPLARVATNQPHLILRFMDAGLHGVHVPWVNTAEGAEQAVQSVKYAPRGIRGLAGTRASSWGLEEPFGAYVERANRETLVTIHIETREAAEAIDDFIAIDGIDVLFLGPTDLSQSLGHPGQVDHPAVTEVMEHVAARVRASDKVLGIYATAPAFAERWAGNGARYITTGIESFIKAGSADYLAAVRG